MILERAEGNATDPLQAALVGPPDPEIVELEKRMRIAQLGSDVAGLDALIAESLLFAGPTGDLGTKAEDLEAHGAGIVRFLSHEPEELWIRRVGSDAAIASLRTRLVVQVGGQVHRGIYRYTRVWARESAEGWRVVGGHVSQVTGLGLKDDGRSFRSTVAAPPED